MTIELALALLRREEIGQMINLYRRVQRLQARGVSVPDDLLADLDALALRVLA